MRFLLELFGGERQPAQPAPQTVTNLMTDWWNKMLPTTTILERMRNVSESYNPCIGRRESFVSTAGLSPRKLIGNPQSVGRPTLEGRQISSLKIQLKNDKGTTYQARIIPTRRRPLGTRQAPNLLASSTMRIAFLWSSSGSEEEASEHAANF